MRTLAASRHSLRAIAMELGVSYETVRNRLRTLDFVLTLRAGRR